MTEVLKYIPDNPDDEPEIHFIQADDNEILGTRFNTTLYTFLGHLAIMNHIFLEIERDGNRMKGARMWSNHPNYHRLKDYMVENQYPAEINQIIVRPEDVEAYDEHVKEITIDTDMIDDEIKQDISVDGMMYIPQNWE